MPRKMGDIVVRAPSGGTYKEQMRGCEGICQDLNFKRAQMRPSDRINIKTANNVFGS